MKRMGFDSQGKLISVDNKLVEYNPDEDNELEMNLEPKTLQTSESLQFLKKKKIEKIIDNSSWSLYSNGEKLKPLKFSNGKTQEDVVNEIVSLIRGGNKIIFLHGVCGTGKSAIALNIARMLGKASIVVPIKNLQKQYEKDYMGDKYLLKPNGEVMRIAMITGRENHDSLVEPGVSCGDQFLPDTIKITEKNYDKLLEYYYANPFITSKSDPLLKHIKRISIAPANPYWSPIRPALFDLFLPDAKKKRYTGMQGKEYIFYHRKEGCSYYDQFLAYIEADVIIFNSAKYKIESAIGRKPQTEVEIIDEADEFLDSLSNQVEMNLNYLSSALKNVFPESDAANEAARSILDLIDLEHKNKLALGVNEEQIFQVNDTQIGKMIKILIKNEDLQAEISLDELNYANKLLEASKLFEDSLNETYLTYRKFEGNLYVTLASTNLAKKLEEIVTKNKAVIFMSGTLHSESVLKNIFGISNFKIVEAETLNQGSIDIIRTGKEFDCRYSNFNSKKNSREEYLTALSSSVERAKYPVLVHVNAFSDLPSEEELIHFGLRKIISSERLRKNQFEDKKGEAIASFKGGLNDALFTTRCSRGIDFPGEMCNSVIFTKYPNPNINDIFWKILQKTHPKYFWDFYKDKAKREFLQRIYRAIRSQDDHVFVLSPDSRVLDAARELQMRAIAVNKN